MTRYLYGAAALCLLVLGSVLYGEHRVQVKVDLERERQETIAALARETDKAAKAADAEQHKKDIEHAKSQAGRTAIAAWLKSHGLLPDGSPVSGPGGCEADSAGGSDGAPGQSGTGGRIEKFAEGCALDALHVLRWQEWAIREGLTTVP
jgi:hypothetical protein